MPAKSLLVHISTISTIAENTDMVFECRAEGQPTSVKDTTQLKKYSSTSENQGSGAFNGNGATGTFTTEATETPNPPNKANAHTGSAPAESAHAGFTQTGFIETSHSNAHVTAKFLRLVADFILV